MTTATPQGATLFAFNVGFGDCLLLRFDYGGGTRRHVLIDLGTTHPPEEAKGEKKLMMAVAREIEALCGGKLDIVVATHRHKDHIGGFATSAKSDAPGNIIAALKPDMVLQPWTEDPDLAENAISPSARGAVGMRAYTRTLSGMNEFAASLGKAMKQLKPDGFRRLGFDDAELKFLTYAGQNNIANRSAVENLMTMAPASGTKYLHAGMPLDIEAILPGVRCDVLGPPTVEQHGRVARQNPSNEDEYWHMQAASGARSMLPAADAEALFPNKVRNLTPSARWIARQLADLRKDMFLSIVRALDKAINNTSLILLFTVRGKSLLFPGDAQWENWEFALSDAKIRGKLEKVDLYKVGHHGSLNATPKSLWRLFKAKSKDAKKGRLVSVMSTLHGVHGESEETEVPRSTLVAELEAHSDHHTTERLTDGRLYDEIPIEL